MCIHIHAFVIHGFRNPVYILHFSMSRFRPTTLSAQQSHVANGHHIEQCKCKGYLSIHPSIYLSKHVLNTYVVLSTVKNSHIVQQSLFSSSSKVHGKADQYFSYVRDMIVMMWYTHGCKRTQKRNTWDKNSCQRR